MNATTLSRLAAQIDNLSRVLEELDGATRPELKAAMEGLYTPQMPTQRGLQGAAPLDTQLMANATDAQRTAYECDMAASEYDSLAQQVKALLGSPTLKALGDLTKYGKAKAAERRKECEKLYADAQTELSRRQQAREQAMAELEAAKAVEDEVKRMREEIATLRATFL